MNPRRDWGRILVVAAAVLVVAAAAGSLLAPSGTEVTATVSGDGGPEAVEEERTTTMWGQIRDGEEDRSVLLVLLLPAAVALGALAVDGTRIRRTSRMGAAVLISAFTLLALASVGLFYLPGAAAMVGAALVPERG